MPLPVKALPSWRQAAAALLATVLCASLLLYWAGSRISAPRNHAIGAPPSDFPVQAVLFADMHGWWVKARQPNGHCVLLMHGVGADRTSMLGRARWLETQGYSSLLFDFQAHGQSPGSRITFGAREAGNAAAALAYLRASGQCRKVAAIGQSLGGAASLLGEGPIPVDALVLEAVYPSIEQAISNRLAIRLGEPGRLLTPLLARQIPLRLGIELEALQPIKAIRRLRAPLLIIAGGRDRHTPAAESRALFANAPAPKAFWLIEDAAHVDFYAHAPQAYERRVLEFLSRSLQAP
ncbi:MAG: alpha/beta hydrolase [Pseudomonas sp.]|uniref:alpha/beta hydrolase n=1 Tax=Pseudomonas sp. TaxID=306 RepID=UPI00339953D1